MKTITLLIITIIFFTFNSFSQIITIDPGKFEVINVTPWGEGTLVTKRKKSNGYIPFLKIICYFDETGKLLWEKEIKHGNQDYSVVMSKDSEYAFLLNTWFAEKIDFNSTELSNCVNYFRISKSGDVKEFSIPLLKIEHTEKKAFIKFLFACITNDKLNLMFSTRNEDNKDDKLLTYQIMQIDPNGKDEVKKLDNFTIPEQNWIKTISSNPTISSCDNNSITFIQATRTNENIVFITSVFNSSKLTMEKEIKMTMNTSKLNGLFVSQGVKTTSETAGIYINLSAQSHVNGNYYTDELDQYFSSKIIGSTLIIYGNSHLSKENIVGIWSVKINLDGENIQKQESEIIDISKIPEFSPKKINASTLLNRSILSHNVELINNNCVYYIEGKDNAYYKIEKGISKKIESKLTLSSTVLSNNNVLAEIKKDPLTDTAVFFSHKNLTETFFYYVDKKMIKVLKY